VESDPEILGGEAVRLERRRQDSHELGGGEPPPPWNLPAWARVVMILAVVAVALGWYVDHRIEGRESASLAMCDRQLRSVSHDYDVRMGAMFDYVRPSFGMPDRGEARLVSQLMAEPARQVLPDAEAAVAGCQGVHVLPWHASNLAHRNAFVAYGSALVRRLDDVAGGRIAFQIEDRHLARLRAAAGIPAALGS
jgi:hypothetical protein